MTGALYSITGCVSAIIFALIGDRIQFRILFVLFSFVLSVTSFAFPASFNSIYWTKKDIFDKKIKGYP